MIYIFNIMKRNDGYLCQSKSIHFQLHFKNIIVEMQSLKKKIWCSIYGYLTLPHKRLLIPQAQRARNPASNWIHIQNIPVDVSIIGYTQTLVHFPASVLQTLQLIFAQFLPLWMMQMILPASIATFGHVLLMPSAH